MTAAGLVMELRSRGVTLVADGGTLRCRPKSALSDADIAALKVLKPEILARLRQPKTGRPQSPPICFACKRRRFWISVYGVAVCSVCHPPAAPDLVRAWIEPSNPDDGVNDD